MERRITALTEKGLKRIQHASLEVLREVGVAFHDPEALAIFKKHGVKTEGKTVFLEERHVARALESAPSRFTLSARNPERDVVIGGRSSALVPAYGAPFMVTETGEQRKATMEDYRCFCKLVQTSEYINMNGFLMVEPTDVPPETAHLDMLYWGIVLCDKPFMGSPISREAAIHAVEMGGIAFGGKDKIRDKPVMISLITPLSPLQYSAEMAGALIEFARWGQPLLIADLVMAGSSGPMTPAGLLALQSAEILAGITLAQLIRPGLPVVYGGILCPTDMRTGTLAIGAPETSMMIPATAQLARFYGLPARGGGALTDAHVPDMQAGIESTLALVTAAMSGVHFVLHACGIMGSFMAMSYGKFLADEELCGMVLRAVEPIDTSDKAIDVETIKQVGIGGEYLTHPSTLDHCRTGFFLPRLANRQDYVNWNASGRKTLEERARALVPQRLAAYRKPEIDPQIEKDLSRYLARRKRG